MQRFTLVGAGIIALCLAGPAAAAPLNIGIVAAEASPPVSALLATGLFGSVTALPNANSTTPTLAQLQGFDAVLTYTDYPPADAIGLGNVLRQYVDAGGRVVLGTYAFSFEWSIRGGIMATGYSPLVDSGTTGSVSGTLRAVAASPIFDGLTLGTISYFHNGNFAHPTLGDGATLLADDGAGTNMIAINGAGNIIANNLFPSGGNEANDANFFRLIANELAYLGNGGAVATVPEPVSASVLALGLLGLAGFRRRG